MAVDPPPELPSEPRRRVACYVVRDRGHGREMLLFEHVDVPEAGMQVPAGGVRPGESDLEAAMREVSEETGLSTRALTVVRRLGVSPEPRPATGRPQRTTYVLLRYDGRAAARDDAWTRRVTGEGQDSGLLFRCWFEPLPLGVALAGRQGEFLHLL